MAWRRTAVPLPWYKTSSYTVVILEKDLNR